MNQFLAIYKLVLKHQVTRGRVILVLLATGLFALLGRIALSEPDPTETVVGVLALLGQGLIIPVICLLLGSGSMGDWHNDETLVYVWLRPVRRVIVAAAATAAAITVAVPATVLPMVAAVVMSGEIGGGVLSGTITSTLAITVAYTAVFTLLGLLVRKPLPFGLIYVFVWELFISRTAEGAQRLSINSYGASMLSRATDISLDFAGRSQTATIIVPIAVALAAVTLSGARLDRMEVA